MAPPEPIAEKKSWLGYFAGVILHTLIVYAGAEHLSPRLVFHWFGWAMPILHTYSSIPATDWYLQHFLLMTILPALVLGCLNVGQSLPKTIHNLIHEDDYPPAIWAWSLPTSVILYKMLEYHAPSSSVLYGNSTTAALKYFFAIQTVMPTFQNRLASDPIRVLAQMTITVPFYAGVAYSLGALLRKHRLLTKISVFEKPDQPAREQNAHPTPRALE